MRRIALLSLFVFVLACGLVSAQTVVINYTDSGWYLPTGLHRPSNINYIVGDNRGPSCNDCSNDVRNFFVFNLSSVSQPIESAKLALYIYKLIPNTGTDDGYKSGDPSENYELHDVVTSLSSLIAGTGGVAAHNDLGTGVVYGSRTMTAADIGSVVEITLNSNAIFALNATHGLFGIGGSITTLDSLPNDEYTFGHSHENGIPRPELRLTLVPEPSTLLLLGIAAISLLRYRNAKLPR